MEWARFGVWRAGSELAANELWDAAFSEELHHVVVGGVANTQATTLPGWFLTSSSSAEPSSFQATSSSSQHRFRKMCGFRSSAPRDGHRGNGFGPIGFQVNAVNP
ncbi:hypothetical protein DFH09DRAFT_1091815 [Mycena vulgaris]|nr:hypothetical protein DFH09DRAFT_1091815 [Mycena vulgaris]